MKVHNLLGPQRSNLLSPNIINGKQKRRSTISYNAMSNFNFGELSKNKKPLLIKDGELVKELDMKRGMSVGHRFDRQLTLDTAKKSIFTAHP